MVTTSHSRSSDDSALDRGSHHERREKLLEARAFRLEQLSALELERGQAPQASVNRALHMAATTALGEIDAALDRIARGVYGRCVSCARPIPEDRLDVLPMAAQCMLCHFAEQNSHLSG
jgi:RNA polymerase-binding transcription factor DksA